MTDLERHQLIADLMVLSNTVASALETAQGEQLRQLLELSNESEAALRELQEHGARGPTNLANLTAGQQIST